MSYLAFLAVWIVPPILGLLALRRGPAAGVGGFRARWAIPLLALIALVYTTPWDNYLVWRGVWGYGNGRVVGTIGYVPIEEYVFFLLQPFLTGLLLYRLLERAGPPAAPSETARTVGVGVFALATLAGAALLLAPAPSGTYLGLILAWACPVLAFLWYLGGDYFWACRRPLFGAIGLSTGYLWVADRYAIANGIWGISETLSFNVNPAGLPVEEAVFFLVTNLLCAFGTLAFLHGDRVARIRRLQGQAGAPADALR